MGPAPVRPPELSELEAFVLSVEEGSIARAAARLRIPAPATAKRIRQLEALTSAALLIRGARGVTPTEAGARLYPVARDLVTQRGRLMEAISREPPVDPLRIAGMRRLLGRPGVPAAEELLKDAEVLLAAIFHAASDPLVLVRPEDGSVAEINDAAARLLGYDRDDLRTRTIIDADLWEDPARRGATVHRAVATGRPQRAELVVRIRGGDRRLVTVYTQPIALRAGTTVLTAMRAFEDVPGAGLSAGDASARPNGDVALARRFLAALRAGEPRRAMEVAHDALDSGFGVGDVHSRVMEPAMRDIGDLWEHDVISIADEHLATAITHEVAARIFPRARCATPRSRERILLAAVDGERHVLGLRLAADLLDGAGYDSLFLGGDVPLTALLDACRRHRPAVVGLSLALPMHVAALADALAALGQLDDAPAVMVGGRAAPAVPAAEVAAAVVEHDDQAVAVVEQLLERRHAHPLRS